MRRASAPDDGSYPGKRNHQHIYYRTEHEDLNRAVTLRKASEVHAKQAIHHTEQKPAKQAGSQQVTGHSPETKNGNQRQQRKENYGCKISQQGKSVEKRYSIRQDYPSAEDRREKDPHINARAHRCISESMKPLISRHVCADGRQVVRSQVDQQLSPGATKEVSQHPRRRSRWARFHFQLDRRQSRNTSSGGRAPQTYHDTPVRATGPALLVLPLCPAAHFDRRGSRQDRFQG